MRSGIHRRVAPGALCLPLGWRGSYGGGWEGCPGEGRGVESGGTRSKENEVGIRDGKCFSRIY